jgi:thiol-disulfide isomerase/thioredoxin
VSSRLVAALFLVLVALASLARGDAPVEEPPFMDLAGRQVHVSDHRGDVVLLHFWATWCGACKPEMPALARIHATLGPKGLRILGAAANGRDEAELVKSYMRANGMKFESWVWVSAKDMAYYGVGPGLPASVLIDRDGTVVKAIRGPVDERTLAPIVEELLARPAAVRK